MRLARRVAFFACCVAAFGCDRSDVFSPLLTCDVALESCQEAIYRSVARLLDAESLDMPPVRVISVEEYEAELNEWYEPDEVEEGPGTIASRLMGFIPNDSTTIVDNVIDQKLSDVWAYYRADPKSVTIIDRDYDPLEVNPLLAHEFAHAIQDEQFGLIELWNTVETEDQFVTVRSVIEGDAQHLEWAWFFWVEGFELTSGEWDQVHSDGKSWLLGRVRDPQVRFLDTVADFPYIYGFEFMADTSLAGGLPARHSVWGSPPRTTAAIMKGYSAFIDGSADVDSPAMVAHPSPVAGYEARDEAPLGMWYVYAFLIRLGVSEGDAWGVANDMNADSFGLFQSESDVSVVWRMSFDATAYPTIVQDAVANSPRPVSWHALVEDNDVFVIASQNDEALAMWTAQPLDSNIAVAAKSRARRSLLPRSVGTCIEFH